MNKKDSYGPPFIVFFPHYACIYVLTLLQITMFYLLLVCFLQPSFIVIHLTELSRLANDVQCFMILLVRKTAIRILRPCFIGFVIADK